MKHYCRLTEILSEEERIFLGELLDNGIEEAQEALARHESEPPPGYDEKSLSDAAQDYANVMLTAKSRLAAYERVAGLLQMEY